MRENSSPLVSIIIPYYNLGKYLEETVKSVLRQSYTEFEIILVDDGTDDKESLRVLDSVRECYQLARVISQRNRGVASARNAGIRCARGKYIVPLDADDSIEPTYLEKCIWFLETHPEIAYVYTGVKHFGDIDAACMDEFDFERLKTYNFITVTAMFQKKHFEEVGGYSIDTREGGYEDWDFWLSMGERGYYGALIPELLFNYRRRSNSRLLQSKEQHDQIISDLKKAHPALYVKSETDGRRGARGVPSPASDASSINHVLDYYAVHGYTYRKYMRNSTWSANAPRINLLCIFPWLEVGGADLVNLNILQWIDRSRFNISIMTTLKSANRWYDKFYHITTDIYALAHFIPEEQYLDFLLSFIENRRIDIIFISNSFAGFNMLPCIKKYFPAIRVVDLQHMEEPSWWGGGFPKIGAHFDNCIDRHIVVSRYLKKYMADNFDVSPHKTEVIHNGIDVLNTFNPDRYPLGQFRREMQLSDDTKLITTIGRVCEQKQPLVFVRIAEELVHTRGHRDLFFLIVGDGELREATEKLIRELRLENYVKITGYRDDVCQILRDTDVLVQPSLNEGFPIVALEAMAMRVPVVIARVGGIAELIDGHNGVLVDKDASRLIEAYSDAVEEMIANKDDLAKMRELARRTVCEEFNVDNMVRKYENSFTKLMRKQTQ